MVESRNKYTAILINHDSIMGPCVSVAYDNVERTGFRAIKVVLCIPVDAKQLKIYHLSTHLAS